MQIIGKHENENIYYEVNTQFVFCKNLCISYKEFLYLYKTQQKDRNILLKGDKMSFIKSPFNITIGCFSFSYEEIDNLIKKIKNINYETRHGSCTSRKN